MIPGYTGEGSMAMGVILSLRTTKQKGGSHGSSDCPEPCVGVESVKPPLSRIQAALRRISGGIPRPEASPRYK